MLHFEQSLAVLAGTGLSAPARFEVLAVVDAYVFGSALRAAESRAETDPETVRAITAYGLRRLATGRFPHTAALLASHEPGSQEVAGRAMAAEAMAAQFERGLQAVLDGLVALGAYQGRATR
ncbi:TetR/AcrR family transcriptional regulator C-terminal domain-containing protein [Dactylosporangium sp. CA-233914]|uniref:TetR/AcrR family transcriptional regulator C-terminal domain-containing protein n=1 Tax=Dactylosporangium sp. CA-233914 TaxID=3239934 RepID=UPI003D8F730B